MRVISYGSQFAITPCDSQRVIFLRASDGCHLRWKKIAKHVTAELVRTKMWRRESKIQIRIGHRCDKWKRAMLDVAEIES